MFSQSFYFQPELISDLGSKLIKFSKEQNQKYDTDKLALKAFKINYKVFTLLVTCVKTSLFFSTIKSLAEFHCISSYETIGSFDKLGRFIVHTLKISLLSISKLYITEGLY